MTIKGLNKKDFNSEKKIRNWLQEILAEGKMYGNYKCYVSGWIYVEEVIEVKFDDELMRICSNVLTELLCEIRKGVLDWREEKINRLLLVAQDFDDPFSNVSTEIRKIAKEGGFESLDLQKRLLQSLLSKREFINQKFWTGLLERNPEVFSSYAFAGLYHFNLKNAFEILNEVDWEEETNWGETYDARMFNEIRGLLSSEDYDTEEVIQEAKRSKNYLKPAAYHRVKRALPEMNE